MKNSKGMWIFIAVIAALVFFGPELMSILGWVIGGVISIGITGIVMLAIAAAVFFGVVLVGGSIAVAVMVTLGALLLATLSALWPILLIVGGGYLVFRKRPQTV